MTEQERQIEEQKVRELLRLPITGLHFIPGENTAKVLHNVNGQPTSAGQISFVRDKNKNISYQITRSQHDEIWSSIYLNQKEEILHLVKELLDNEDIKATLAPNNSLYIRDTNGNFLCTVRCTFINAWDIQTAS